MRIHRELNRLWDLGPTVDLTYGGSSCGIILHDTTTLFFFLHFCVTQSGETPACFQKSFSPCSSSFQHPSIDPSSALPNACLSFLIFNSCGRPFTAAAPSDFTGVVFPPRALGGITAGETGRCRTLLHNERWPTGQGQFVIVSNAGEQQ